MSDRDLAPPAPSTGIIEYHWVNSRNKQGENVPRIMVRLKATNGEIVAQITQGARDKRDARRSVEALAFMFGGDIASMRQEGPGPKPGSAEYRKLHNMAAETRYQPQAGDSGTATATGLDGKQLTYKTQQ